MSRTIYKYPLQITDVQYIEMPKFAEPLTVQVQDGTPYLWAIVDPTSHKERRYFRTAGTGHPLEFAGPDEGKYIATYQHGFRAFHVFECSYLDYQNQK